MADWLNARLAAEMPDPQISLMNHIRNNWDVMVAPGKQNINFDTKWRKGSLLNQIIITEIDQTSEPQTLGGAREHNEVTYIIQVASRGHSAINNCFNMRQELKRIINGDPLGIQTVTIDNINLDTGIDYAWLDRFQRISTNIDAEIIKGFMPETDSMFSWYKATIKIYFDMYRG